MELETTIEWIICKFYAQIVIVKHQIMQVKTVQAQVGMKGLVLLFVRSRRISKQGEARVEEPRSWAPKDGGRNTAP